MLKELYILTKLLFATRPSDYVYRDLEVITMQHFPFKGYKCLSWCGRIIKREGTLPMKRKDLNHEKIHVMQAILCNDSWMRYYLSYLWQWLKHGITSPVSANYYINKYECEAYANEENFTYCQDYDTRCISKYRIKHAKKLYRQLGSTPAAWKAYVKTL